MNIKYQQGIILVVALIMLLVISLVAITTMSSSTLQERITGSMQQKAIARINAESALRDAERTLSELDITNEDSIVTAFKAEDHLYLALYSAADKVENPLGDDNAYPISNPRAWEKMNTFDVKAADDATVTAKYVVEYMGQMSPSGTTSSANLNIETRGRVSPDPFVFRITALGYGANDRIMAILQSIYTTD